MILVIMFGKIKVSELLFALCFLFGFVCSQVQQEVLKKLACIDNEECGACLSAASHCRWCADPYFNPAVPRCNDDFSLVTAGCSQSNIQRPEKSIFEVMENSSLQDMQPNDEAVVQIQPQRVKISLKPRETKKIKFTYRPAKNYPLDLYYLMDLTWSMKDDKETLVSLRDDLPVLLGNLTNNFRLGFGSFADKPLMPYTSMEPKRRANPCDMEEEICDPTYSYRHHLSLTNQVNAFIENVNRSSVTANLDNAEGQLDALVQVVTCGEKIGWSSRSRKIVILLSDGYLHTAGDGLLGGATKRNDEMCHLDDKGYYHAADVFDYPSVAQVYRLLDKYKVNVIFAVTESVKSHYDSLHKILEDFTHIAKLESDSSNVLKLVKTGYEDVVSVVDFEDNSSGGVKVKYFTDCGVKGGSLIETTRCSGVEFGMTLNYEAHVSLDACPEFKKLNQTIKISETQLGQDSLTLEVEIQCGCNCEGDHQDGLAQTCPKNSHLVCGVCQCNKGWSGPSCDCSIEDEAASAALLAKCRNPDISTYLPCSGAGDCLCGRCQCDTGFSGRFCQCRRCEISRENGLECGGAERGSCVCGQCACAAGWSGVACDCTDSNATCIAPHGEMLCSGHGDCTCGRCQCYAADLDGITKYTGNYCETCANCENPLCASAEPCVNCHLNNDCTDVCIIGNVNYTVVENYDDEFVPTKEEDISCYLRRNECEYKYSYSPGTQSMITMAITITSKVCTTPASAMVMLSAIVIIGMVVTVGIIGIFIVKSYQMVSDKRAYAKFEAEAIESRKNMQELNPLYISPISEFKLPDSFPRDRY